MYDIEPWDDSRIRPGADWRQEIRTAVEKANVAVLLISADFLASEFIRENELPPLLKAAQKEGAVIIPLIVSPSLFMRNPELARFHAINSPSAPLVSATRGEQESAFVAIAEAIIEKATSRRAPTQIFPADQENFLLRDTWDRLIKTGDWIFDEDEHRIIGSGTHAYLVSRQEYGAMPFYVEATLSFSNFKPPQGGKLGMNAGIVFGFKQEAAGTAYLNVLFTGSQVFIERNEWGFANKHGWAHLTAPSLLAIENGKPYRFNLEVSDKDIRLSADDKSITSMARPPGVVGRVGLRPWRSKIDCSNFLVRVSL